MVKAELMAICVIRASAVLYQERVSPCFCEFMACSSFRWSKILDFGTNVRLSTGFFYQILHRGCSTNPMATDKKHVCNLVSL